MSSVAVRSYARTHTSVFISDKLRSFLKLLVRHYGLDPQRVVDAWSDWVEHAARTWLESGHLRAVVIEFYLLGSTVAAARWDFPIQYDGNGADDMWIDRLFFEGSFAKAKAPPAGSTYRIVLITDPNSPDVPGVGPTTLRSINGMAARDSGTVIATPDIMASARYYL